MGLQPVVGGRYYGMGNPTFALFATATILLCTAVSSMLVLGRAAAGGGASRWPSSAGSRSSSTRCRSGAPTAVARRPWCPGLVYLVLAVLGLRLTWKRLLLARASGWSRCSSLVAGADWLRAAVVAQPPGPLRAGHHRRQRARHRRPQGPAEHRHPARQRPAHPARAGRPALRHLRAGPAHLVGVARHAALLRPGAHAAGRAHRAAHHADHRLPDQRLRASRSRPSGATLAVPLIVSVSVSYLLDEARSVAQTRSARRRR